jgi:hypothetical protein
MGVVSGIFCTAIAPASAPVLAMRGWKVQWIDSSKPVFHSATNAGAQRTTGVRDWNGVFHGYSAVPPVFPGDTFGFQGQFDSVNDGTTGVSCAANAAICDRIEVTWRGEEGREIEYAVFFSANGAIDLSATVTAMSPDVDPTTPPPSAVSMACTGPAGTITTELRSMKLVITAANRKYSSANTSGETKRTPGNIDGGVVYSGYIDKTTLASLESALQLDTVLQLNYVSTTSYWKITWVRPTKIEIETNRESAENVFATVTNEFHLHNGTTLGSIVSGATGATEHWPDVTTTVWPHVLN